MAVPPGCGHVTVNAGEAPLVMANSVAAHFDSLYGHYRNLTGACFYALAGGEFVRNAHYTKVPELEHVEASAAFSELRARFSEAASTVDRTTSDSSPPCMYNLFLAEPQLFELLTKPQLLEALYE